MLCSNPGTVNLSRGMPEFDIQRGEHDLFLTMEAALAHKEWLLGMKSRFLTSILHVSRRSNTPGSCMNYPNYLLSGLNYS